MTLPALRDTHYVQSEENDVACSKTGCAFRVRFDLYGKREAMRLAYGHYAFPDRTMAELVAFGGVVPTSALAVPPAQPPAAPAEHLTSRLRRSGGERPAGAVPPSADDPV